MQAHWKIYINIIYLLIVLILVGFTGIIKNFDDTTRDVTIIVILLFKDLIISGVTYFYAKHILGKLNKAKETIVKKIKSNDEAKHSDESYSTYIGFLKNNIESLSLNEPVEFRKLELFLEKLTKDETYNNIVLNQEESC
jgi:hypothetical protein